MLHLWQWLAVLRTPEYTTILGKWQRLDATGLQRWCRPHTHLPGKKGAQYHQGSAQDLSAQLKVRPADGRDGHLTDFSFCAMMAHLSAEMA
jgi:hypothetical protein